MTPSLHRIGLVAGAQARGFIMELYLVACSLKTTRKGKWINAIAVAKNPGNDMISFILPNGKPYLGKTVWKYEMAPYEGCTRYVVR